MQIAYLRLYAGSVSNVPMHMEELLQRYKVLMHVHYLGLSRHIYTRTEIYTIAACIGRYLLTITNKLQIQYVMLPNLPVLTCII
jgi:hypothetical protein